LDTQDITASVTLGHSLYPFLAGPASTAEKISAVQTALRGPEGKFWRKDLGEWAARTVPVELLVPDVHREWRPLVREAILFVVSKLSPARLAPKIVEQIELGPDISAEMRLLRFIAKVPALQKIGQVLARNRQLHPRLRRALIKLENGISDASTHEICSIIQQELHSQIDTYDIKLRPTILSEASVSAVVAFTWKNPKTQRRERGVFKVLKPHIPGCYSEDMKILGQLAQHLVRKHKKSGAHLDRLAETLREIRLLLEREVDFPREQSTLANGLNEYRSLRGVRVPRVIPSLCTETITALTYENGKKVTSVNVVPTKLRSSVADRLARVLLAVPALSRQKDPIFHADPHAGNLLYDRRRNELVILDWALTERLTRMQRKNVVLLVLMLLLRDAEGIAKAIGKLCQLHDRSERTQVATIRKHIEHLLDELPLTQLPGPMTAMRLLDTLALEGIRFPAALLMFRKASFTLEGVVQDVAGTTVRLDSLLANHTLANWADTVACLFSVLSARDWVALDWSVLTLPSRVSAKAISNTWRWLPRISANAETS
jgi:ubiquinone biosynthesis protein